MPGHTKGKKVAPMKAGAKMPKGKLSAFGKEFQKHSPGDVFSFKGKNYVRVTADEVKKAGFKTLRDYLNSKGKKITKRTGSMGPGGKTTGKRMSFGGTKKPVKKVATSPSPRASKKRRAAKPIQRVTRVRTRIKKGSRAV
jgi:hypothetical protein